MDKGKNFSCNNASGKRKKSDFYETPYSLTELLLSKEKIEGSSLEPAAGGGAIVRVLERNGILPIFYDQEFNFFNETRQFDWIITNPPFSKALAFIQKAKLHCQKFAFLLPLNYLHGKKRYDHVYRDSKFPLRAVYVFTRYPLLGDPIRDDGKFRTGMMVYAWYVWDQKYVGKPTLDWLDNDPWVIR